MNKYKNRMGDLKQMLDPVLKKVSDRKMFGLSPKPKEKGSQNSTSDKTPPSQKSTSSGKVLFGVNNQ